jgi:hypothetical protein
VVALADEEYVDPLIAEMPGGRGWSSPNGVPAWCCSTGPRGDGLHPLSPMLGRGQRGRDGRDWLRAKPLGLRG